MYKMWDPTNLQKTIKYKIYKIVKQIVVKTGSRQVGVCISTTYYCNFPVTRRR